MRDKSAKNKKNVELKLLCNIIEIRPNTCTTLTQYSFKICKENKAALPVGNMRK